jgi:hypothetical protein
MNINTCVWLKVGPGKLPAFTLSYFWEHLFYLGAGKDFTAVELHLILLSGKKRLYIAYARMRGG